MVALDVGPTVALDLRLVVAHFGATRTQTAVTHEDVGHVTLEGQSHRTNRFTKE